MKNEQQLIDEIENLYLETIAEQIKQGCTSGVLDHENGIRTSWNININNFKI